MHVVLLHFVVFRNFFLHAALPLPILFLFKRTQI